MKNYYLLKFLLLFVCINLTNNVLAQISQVVQIVVVNFNQKPIENVSLIIEDISKAQFFIITDANGIAQASLPVGTYQITAKQLGYAPQSVHDVEVTSGKEINLTIQLTENNFHLPETEITPSKSSTNIGIEISKNEILRSPSSLNDPVRLAALYPGVQLTNDQANHISYRGNDPLFVNWSINGLEVASPNHLSNAGVIGDLPSQSGG
ncbi:MAG: carboxypeptidase-like regulatory domain-containing protein, partial [Saprospiraceae bacterium]